LMAFESVSESAARLLLCILLASMSLP
jgi:hypothetical protein